MATNYGFRPNNTGKVVKFVDNFETNSLSQYTTFFSVPEWNNSGTSIVHNSTEKCAVITTADNKGIGLLYTLPENQYFAESGIFKLELQKTADFPADNNNYFIIYNEDETSYIRVLISGSSYGDAVLERIIDGVTVDSATSPYDFDDQSTSHTFEIRYSKNKLKFLVDDTEQILIDNISNNTMLFKKFAIDSLQFNGKLFNISCIPAKESDI